MIVIARWLWRWFGDGRSIVADSDPAVARCTLLLCLFCSAPLFAYLPARLCSHVFLLRDGYSLVTRVPPLAPLLPPSPPLPLPTAPLSPPCLRFSVAALPRAHHVDPNDGPRRCALPPYWSPSPPPVCLVCLACRVFVHFEPTALFASSLLSFSFATRCRCTSAPMLVRVLCPLSIPLILPLSLSLFLFLSPGVTACWLSLSAAAVWCVPSVLIATAPMRATAHTPSPSCPRA